jgi:hypothetical protein
VRLYGSSRLPPHPSTDTERRAALLIRPARRIRELGGNGFANERPREIGGSAARTTRWRLARCALLARQTAEGRVEAASVRGRRRCCCLRSGAAAALPATHQCCRTRLSADDCSRCRLTCPWPAACRCGPRRLWRPRRITVTLPRSRPAAFAGGMRSWRASIRSPIRDGGPAPGPC